MANYPCSCIYLAPLLEASRFQRVTTVHTNPGFILCIRIYPTCIQVSWQDVTTQIYLGIFTDWNKEAGIPPARWLGGYYCIDFTVCLIITHSAISEYIQHNIPFIESVRDVLGTNLRLAVDDRGCAHTRPLSTQAQKKLTCKIISPICSFRLLNYRWRVAVQLKLMIVPKPKPLLIKVTSICIRADYCSSRVTVSLKDSTTRHRTQDNTSLYMRGAAREMHRSIIWHVQGRQ